MELAVNTREIKRKKVRFLRRQGLTPAHVFGHGIDPVALECDTVELKKILAQAGTTGIVSLKLDNARKARNVMIREVQKEPRTGEVLHVDFYQIRMEEKLKVDIPIVLVGEAPALKMKENFLAHELTNLSVECLPDAIPNKIDVDVSILEDAEQSIHVADIVVDEGITIQNTPEQLVAKISVRFVEKEPEFVEAEVEGEIEGEAPAAEAESEESGEESSSEE